MNITIDGKVLPIREGQTFESVIREHMPDVAHAIAVRDSGRAYGLDMMPHNGGTYSTVTLFESEGRRVYERSLSFLLVKAVEDLYPEARVLIEHSLGNGQYVAIEKNAPLDPDAVAAIEARMREIVALDLPFKRVHMTVKEAVDIFKARGMFDKVRLLQYRPFDFFNLYELDGMLEYFYGEMAPSTGYLKTFTLQYRMPGLVLLMPDRRDPSKPGAYIAMPKVARLFDAAERWGRLLDCSVTADINELIKNGGICEFIRINEALHEREIARIASDIARRGARVVLVAGPSSSGKTSFANRLYTQLRVEGLRPVTISLDDYYKDRELVPLDEDGDYDFESIDALNVEQFNDNLVDLLLGKTVSLPHYDFMSRSRVLGAPRRIYNDQPLIIEGIHGLNEELTRDVPLELKYRVYITPLQQLNLDMHNRIRSTDARILRRMVRDHKFRNLAAEETFARWSSVRRGEAKWIYPYQEEADALFNSSLTYELAVLRHHAFPLLQAIPEDSPHRIDASRLLKFLNYFLDVDVEDEIPPSSILREFIGGSCFFR